MSGHECEDTKWIRLLWTHLLKEFCKFSNGISLTLGGALQCHLLNRVLQELSHLKLHPQLALLPCILRTSDRRGGGGEGGGAQEKDASADACFTATCACP